jgi:alpha-L-fucosidase
MIDMQKKKMVLSLLVAGVMLGFGTSAFSRDLEALQEEYMSWKFGMFIHYNMSTFVSGGWSTGQEDPALFNPTEMDVGQWADAAKSAHMKYGVLTVKHTGGYCLWDSAYTDHDMTMFKNYKNGEGDIVREFCEAFRSRDLKVGLYYCFPLYNPRWANYSTLPMDGYETGTTDSLLFIKNQFTELLTNYGKIDLIWIDQSRTKNGGMNPGDWLAVKAHIHSVQPDCLVVANNQLDYQDTDIYSYEYPHTLKLPPVNNVNPTEVCDKLQHGWFLGRPTASGAPVRDVDYVVNKMLRPLNDRNANYLLNCAPDVRGLMDDGVVSLLAKVGETWSPDEASHAGDELYGITRSMMRVCPNDQQMVALVFDPSWSVSDLDAVAKILEIQDAQGTFFLTKETGEESRKFLKNWASLGVGIGAGSLDSDLLEDVEAVRSEVKILDRPVNASTRKTTSMFYAPEEACPEGLWELFNYLGMVPVGESVTADGSVNAQDFASKITSGSIIKVSNNETSIAQFNALVSALKENGLRPVNLTELMRNSISKRLRFDLAKTGADVVTGEQ